MIVLVVGVNFLFWRPWWLGPRSSGSRTSEAREKPRSLVLDLLRQSHVPRLLRPTVARR